MGDVAKAPGPGARRRRDRHHRGLRNHVAWLSFNHPSVKVVQMHELQRYSGRSAAGAQTLKGGHLYYLAQDRRDRHRSLEPFFASSSGS